MALGPRRHYHHPRGLAPDSRDKGRRYEVLMTCLSLFAPREPTRRLQGATLELPRVRIPGNASRSRSSSFFLFFISWITFLLLANLTTHDYLHCFRQVFFPLSTSWFVVLLGQWVGGGGVGGTGGVRFVLRCEGEATRSRGRPRAERGLLDDA